MPGCGLCAALVRLVHSCCEAYRSAARTHAKAAVQYPYHGLLFPLIPNLGKPAAPVPQALDLKPNYMRAWTNMGISYANLGVYNRSAAFYVRALGACR